MLVDAGKQMCATEFGMIYILVGHNWSDIGYHSAKFRTTSSTRVSCALISARQENSIYIPARVSQANTHCASVQHYFSQLSHLNRRTALQYSYFFSQIPLSLPSVSSPTACSNRAVAAYRVT